MDLGLGFAGSVSQTGAHPIRKPGPIRVSVPSLPKQPETGQNSVIWLAPEGEVLGASARAKAIVARADALVIARGQLRALPAADDQKLRQLVARAAECGETGAMLVPRRFGGRDYFLLVGPAAEDDVGGADLAAVRIRIVDPDSVAGPSPEWLKRLFGLTAAESRLALELLAGRTLAEAADALGISSATSRVHLAHVFRKTRTARQAELMRLLMSYPWDDLPA